MQNADAIHAMTDKIVAAFTSNPNNETLDEAGIEAMRHSVFNALSGVAIAESERRRHLALAEASDG